MADAKKKGARLLLGGTPIKGTGNWFAPTVLADVDHSMLVMRDESFGPIIGLQAVADDDAAVDLMNDTEYGLTAGVYSPRREAREEILKQRRRGHGLLELLRSREPAAAVVRRQAFRHRPHAVDLRHPDLHAPEGVASAQRMRGPTASWRSQE